MELISQVTIDDSVYLATELIEIASNKEKLKDKIRKKQFSRILNNSKTLQTTMHLTDEVMRISSSKASGKILRDISKKVTLKGLGLIDFIGLKMLIVISNILPAFTKYIVETRVKLDSRGIILRSDRSKLTKYIQERKKEDIDVNINVLGEAVLGEEEADKRFSEILGVMELAEVTYISVKISAIVSQLKEVDHEGSVNRVAEKLRVIYTKALEENVFVNLDMEEYRDLEVTIDVFKKLLDEENFENLYAGIVLQAYLPDSHLAFQDLITWAKRRYEKTGGRVKVRIVKGANLAMERTEAELNGWKAGPYESKEEVDASYARLINTAISSEVREFLTIGVASHNLFHIAFAQTLAEIRGCKEQVEIEMLEGMANPEALAVKERFGSVLLYSPITSDKDFPSAVAYLVRRLDENTSDENYLRASFDIAPGNKQFNQQAKRFIDSIHMSHVVNTDSRRRAEQNQNRELLFNEGAFQNQANHDLTNIEFIELIKNKEYMFGKTLIPVVVSGKEYLNLEMKNGLEPGKDGKTLYSYNLSTKDLIDDAVRIAKFEQNNWEKTSIEKVKEIMGNCAKIMEENRPKLIAAMMRDGGKTISEADPEISEAIDFARFYSLSAENIDKDSSALGVVVVAPPWNFPYAIPMGGIASALVSGNSVIFKPAPETILVAWELVNQLWAAGVPKSVLHFLPTEDNEIGKYLITHKDVDTVVLTGSYETALLFKKWKPTLRLLAETSGKNSIIVTASADIDTAVKDIIDSAFGHAGQKCSATSLAIVEESIYNNPTFFKQLKDAVTSLKAGDPSDLSTSVGPLISPVNKNLTKVINELEEGEEWLVEPKQLESVYTWSPGVKINVQPGSWAHQNEWFGPVLGVMKAKDLKQAVDWQNSVEYGLTAGIQSLNEKECEYWIENVEAGNLYVNRTTTGAVVNRHPFGGWKKSSFGPTAKAGGDHYVSMFRKYKLVENLETLRYEFKRTWDEIGNKSIKLGDTESERNFKRYIPYKDVLVVTGDDFSKEYAELILWIADLLKINIKVVSIDLLLAEESTLDISIYEKIRWISTNKEIPTHIFNSGATVDERGLSQNGSQELLCWVKEQSISITNHRYGNIGAGPQPFKEW